MSSASWRVALVPGWLLEMLWEAVVWAIAATAVEKLWVRLEEWYESRRMEREAPADDDKRYSDLCEKLDDLACQIEQRLAELEDDAGGD